MGSISWMVSMGLVTGLAIMVFVAVRRERRRLREVAEIAAGNPDK